MLLIFLLVLPNYSPTFQRAKTINKTEIRINSLQYVFSDETLKNKIGEKGYETEIHLD